MSNWEFQPHGPYAEWVRSQREHPTFDVSDPDNARYIVGGVAERDSGDTMARYSAHKAPTASTDTTAETSGGGGLGKYLGGEQ